MTASACAVCATADAAVVLADYDGNTLQVCGRCWRRYFPEIKPASFVPRTRR